MGPKKCEVCVESQSKYKCPACLIPYCSLPCFKKHKEIPCSKPETLEEDKVVKCKDPGSGTNHDKPCYIDEQSELLEESQLQSLASSNEIRDLIQNKKLQKLIYDIDHSEDPDNDLEKAMEDESFCLFTQKVLPLLDQDTHYTVKQPPPFMANHLSSSLESELEIVF